ncbi:uncharacterized protein LOC123396909 [Hordeum vulgare subsp. vulgare]|uniref:uncharacterized protein LOC123396909 n=1 Tax=Hordeum vulgare subsp. vulgare TaxID=112509 RepID=UPI001D1A3D38|nr:uncharacterized protein LOC123396909 [Hordeum vulgare subsp. vulgare]
MENMIVSDLNCTPCADEMDEDPVVEMDEDALLQMDEDGGVEQTVRKRDNLDDKQKYAAYVALHTLCMSRGGKFNRDYKKKVADFFGVGVWNIQRVWKKAMRQIAQGLEVDISSQRKGNCGRKAKDINLDQIPTIPLNKRSTVRSLAWQLGCSPTTLHTKFMLKLIKRHSNCVKPILKEKNIKDRMKFCLSVLDETTIETGRPKLKTMHNIHY